ncbi:TetR/AcrR family transcriptional regulator [Gorillibacterium timonense]|uniref:TetR/AcrR family transcriptional regulator n=1 Tax=Gorillibacterium timonense TaxID=1689269 RepID=UPI00071D1D51|nr:TetR-like C-terminal domain-containing protein [Gorillibacterium timonense]
MSQITKKALAASLKSLLEKTTLDKITVKDIADDCEVNRQTFYYHFQDVYDLLRWILDTDAERVLGDKKTYDTWQQGFLQVLGYVRDNKSFATNAYRSLGREHLESYLYKMTHELLYSVVEESSAGLNVTDEHKTFIADFYKYAFVGLVLDWIRTDMREEPAVIIAKLSRLLEGEFRSNLEKFVEPAN